MLWPGAIFKLKIHQNAYAAGASSRTPLGEITELPQTPYIAGFQGSASRQGRGGEERKEKEGEEEKGRG